VALYTHITTEASARRITRRGISTRRRRRPDGVFAMPILPNFYASHQWLRELRRRSHRKLVAVDFRLDDTEEVLIGHYGQPKTRVTAVQAAALLMNVADPRGYEVLISRTILPKEIRGFRSVPQVVGWRYWPESHGREPCGCPVCTKGDYGAAKVRERFRQ